MPTEVIGVFGHLFHQGRGVRGQGGAVPMALSISKPLIESYLHLKERPHLSTLNTQTQT